jgi:DNA-directed RNA polymerase II subunit RPB9
MAAMTNATGAAGAVDKQMMRFCGSCNNLLYPRENRETRTLEFACRPPCVYVESAVADNSCVFRNELVKDSSTRLDVILSDMNKDPTLQRTTDIVCAVCSGHEAVTFTVRGFWVLLLACIVS